MLCCVEGVYSVLEVPVGSWSLQCLRGVACQG